MRTKILFIYFFSLGLNAQGLPQDFYMKETYKNFVKENFGDTYYIEKRVDNNFITVLEEYRKNIGLIKKSESVFINPVSKTSYNDYYQITKNSNYKKGKVISTSYFIGNSNNCFVKCGVEIFYKNAKVYRKVEYPGCLSLFNVETRKLDYKNSYVEENCIPN